jgi:hypothetical protein
LSSGKAKFISCSITSLHGASTAQGAILLQLFYAVSIPQRVERVLTAVGGGRDVGNHRRLAVADERVLQHLGQLGASKRRVLLVEVESADALLQSKERLVDFGTIELCLLVCVHRVGSALTACQVDETDFAV